MLSLLAAAALTSTAHCGYEGEVRATGLARQPASGDLAYCEYHLPTENGRTQVLYYNPSGYRIAEKILVTPGASPNEVQRPQVRQQDYRHGEQRQALQKDGQWELRYRESRDSGWERALLDDVVVDVVDAGFDAFVRKSWARLSAGRPVEFSFASPLHGRAVTLRASRIDCREGSPDNLCLQVDLAQPLFRLFAGDLYLVYSTGQRQLKTFEGIVNLLDRHGKSQRLRIDYHYQ